MSKKAAAKHESSIDEDSQADWESEKAKLIEDLRTKETVPSLRTMLKQLGFAGKVDKLRKDDLIEEICKIKQLFEWNARAKNSAKPSKKQQRWEREEVDEAPKPAEKRARIPAFLAMKEQEA